MAGLSFLPSANISTDDQASTSALAPGQSPLEVLTLNLPKILGAKPLASANLMTPKAASTPQDMVLRALMTSMMGGAPAADGGNLADELRRRLGLSGMGDQLSGAPASAPHTQSMDGAASPPFVPNTPTPTPGSLAPTPTFTPGSDAHINNSLFNLRPVTGPQTIMGGLRRQE